MTRYFGGLLSLSAAVLSCDAFVLPSAARPRALGSLRSSPTLRTATTTMSDATAEDTAACKHIAVIGGGWAGWGAAKALIEAGCRVTLLDATPDPTGATPQRSASGKPVEPGVRGFWMYV